MTASTTSSSRKPRVRAMFVDARENRGSIVSGLLTAGHATRTRLGFAMHAETQKLDVLFEDVETGIGAAAPLADRVERCRGIDVAVVVAGRATGRAADTLRMLHACGVRKAVALFEHADDEGSARDLRENLGRHLLLGTAFEADEVPIVSLHGSSEALDARDAATLFGAIDDVAMPRVDEQFLVAGANARGTQAITSRLVRGSIRPPRGKGSLFLPARPTIIRGRSEIIPSRPGLFLAHHALEFVDCIRVDIARPLIEGERVHVFGGDFGCVDGVVKRGRIELAGPIAMFDDRVGVVRYLGYAQLWSCFAQRAERA
jgi:hypothetical protein